LGRPARGQADAAALRRLRKGSALSAPGLSALPFNFFFKAEAPYIVALVDMDAGVRINAPLRGTAEGDLAIGQPVRLQFEPVTKDVTLPYFTAK
jgi:uncharacterized OB-fold protein